MLSYNDPKFIEKFLRERVFFPFKFSPKSKWLELNTLTWPPFWNTICFLFSCFLFSLFFLNLINYFFFFAWIWLSLVFKYDAVYITKFRWESGFPEGEAHGAPLPLGSTEWEMSWLLKYKVYLEEKVTSTVFLQTWWKKQQQQQQQK